MTQQPQQPSDETLERWAQDCELSAETAEDDGAIDFTCNMRNAAAFLRSLKSAEILVPVEPQPERFRLDDIVLDGADMLWVADSMAEGVHRNPTETVYVRLRPAGGE